MYILNDIIRVSILWSKFIYIVIHYLNRVVINQVKNKKKRKSYWLCHDHDTLYNGEDNYGLRETSKYYIEPIDNYKNKKNKLVFLQHPKTCS